MSIEVEKVQEHKEIIRVLGNKASEVKNAIKGFRKRRPIVIEFSGSPKSGKTTSINSLMQFLKKNEFSVKVIRESASICPVANKQSPMFNIWTACDSIKGLVGSIEGHRNKYDVIILDRGIFDALCWFKWLYTAEKLELEMYSRTVDFLTMERFVKYIDIVFVFTADPDKSIEREYSSLLTDIPGSIMNQEVLNDYSTAVQAMIEIMGKHFRNIKQIDTTHKNQDEVGKVVVEQTLDVLLELFIEKVGYFEPDERFYKSFKNNSWLKWKEFDRIEVRFDLRYKVEASFTKIQVVPILTLTSGDKVLLVKKPENAVGENSQEKNKLLAYVGGHIREEDKKSYGESNFLNLCKEALYREVQEELGICVATDDLEPGFIYIQDKSQSERHLAVCFRKEVNAETLKLKMDSNELVNNKGKSKSGKFAEYTQIEIEQLDNWSKSLLAQYFGLDIKVGKQIGLFDK